MRAGHSIPVSCVKTEGTPTLGAEEGSLILPASVISKRGHSPQLFWTCQEPAGSTSNLPREQTVPIMELFFFRLAKLNNTQTVYWGDVCNRTKESPSVFMLWIEWNVFFDYFSSLSNAVSRSSHVPSAYIDSLPWSLHWWQPACDQLQWSWCVFIYKKSWPSGPCRHAWQVLGFTYKLYNSG